MDQFAQNIRFAFRTLGANQMFAAFAILTLGLGIGANTAMFDVLKMLVLKPLPYAGGDQLDAIRRAARGSPDAPKARSRRSPDSDPAGLDKLRLTTMQGQRRARRLRGHILGLASPPFRTSRGDCPQGPR